MYIEGRPLSTYQPTQGWSMPSTLASNSLKKPPIGNPGPSTSSSMSSNALKPPVRPLPPTSKSSSSSSLSGLEQTVPPFQEFLKQTAPLDSIPNKPLPPTPFATKSSHTSLRDSSRRSSSVYSRTPSQWAPESETSWRTEDLDDHPPPTLKAIAYSVSTPDFKSEKTDVKPQVLEPRVFSPLLVSPTLSIVTTPSSSPQSRPVTALLPLFTTPALKKPKVHMMTLEKAQEAMSAPGAALLPEERRAQALSKPKSQGHMRIPSAEMFAPPFIMPEPEPANKVLRTTLVDKKGRFRLVKTPPGTTAKLVEYPFPPATLQPPASSEYPGRMSSLAEYTPTATFDDEERGRTQERGLRGYDMTSFMLPPQQEESLNDVYSDQSRGLRDISASSAYDSDDSIRARMKMVPQPLFSGKLPARDSGNPRGSGSSRPVLSRRSTSQGSMASSGAGSSRFPLRLSMSPPQSRHTSGGSTFGHIPISPPSATAPTRPKSPPSNARPQMFRSKKSHRREKSQSQYYPHVMHRSRSRSKKGIKKSDKKGKKSIEKEPQAPGVPLLAADIIVKQLQTPNTSPLTSNPVTPSAPTHKSTPSDGSEKSKKPLLQRMAQGVTNFGRRKSSTDRDSSPSSRPTPSSPHLYPSPTSSKPTFPSHLGWSTSSTQSYDEAITPPQTPRPKSKIAHSARALDGRLASTDAPESSLTPRKPSLNVFGQVGHFLDALHEKKVQDKAVKDREALKRSIRVVVNEGGRGSEEAGRRSGEARQGWL